MKPIKSAFFAAAFLMFPLSAGYAAPSTVQDEESAYILCSDLSGAEAGTAACVDWIVSSMVASTYKARIDSIAKLVSEGQLNAWRIEAEKKIPKNAEPMMAVALELDILNAQSDAKAKQATWGKLIQWANKLAPQQRRIVMHEIAFRDDFTEQIQSKEMKGLIAKCRDDAVEMLPDIPDETISFLSRLEELAPSQMTPQARAILVSSELDKRQFSMAREHLKDLDVGKLPAKLKDLLLKKISAQFAILYGEADIASSICYPEAMLSEHRMPDWFNQLTLDQGLQMQLMSHKVASYLESCKFTDAAALLTNAYERSSTVPEYQKLLNSVFSVLEANRNIEALKSFAREFAKLTPSSLERFRNAQGKTLSKLILDFSSPMIDFGASAHVIQMLEPMLRFVQPAQAHEASFNYGRALQAGKRSAEARQVWTKLIEDAPHTVWRTRAIQMVIRSFEGDKKVPEAEAFRIQYLDK